MGSSRSVVRQIMFNPLFQHSNYFSLPIANQKEVVKNNMAVSMRLMRFGGKKSPFYRIVVSDRRSPRDGRFIDQVGTYDPKKDPVEVRFKEEKAIRVAEKGSSAHSDRPSTFNTIWYFEKVGGRENE